MTGELLFLTAEEHVCQHSALSKPIQLGQEEHWQLGVFESEEVPLSPRHSLLLCLVHSFL